MDNAQKKRVVSEMIDAAARAIEEYARSARGADLCGQTKVTKIGNVLEIKCHVGTSGPDYFNLRIVRAQ